MKQGIAQFDDLAGFIASDFELMAVDAVDGPVHLACAVPRHAQATGHKPRLPAGRGLTWQQAQYSAAAEALELQSSLAQNMLRQPLQSFQNNQQDHVHAVELASGAAATLPAQDVFLDYAHLFDQPLTHDADSGGCAAGPDLSTAVHWALLECVERDAFAIWWFGKFSRRHLTRDMIESCSSDLAAWIYDRPRQTRVIDITCDTRCPTIVAASHNAAGQEIAIGVACRENAAEAIISALCEMAQMEASLHMALAACDPEAESWAALASTETMPQFQCAGPVELIDARKHRTCLSGLVELGYRPLAVDLTLADSPLPVARVIVPGLSKPTRQRHEPRIHDVESRLAPTQFMRSDRSIETLHPF